MSTSTIPQYPIGTNPPKSVPWNPVEIIYSRLTMKDPTDPTTALLKPADYVINVQPGEPDPVAAFIKMRQADPSAPVKHNGVYPNGNPKCHPCDIVVKHQCYVIIEIDNTLPWQFCTSQACITLKGIYQHNGDDDNFGLIMDSTARFAAFNVAIRSSSSGPDDYNNEGYNIVIQAAGDPNTIYIIDPDTTNQNQIPA